MREALAEAGYNNAVAIVPRTTDLWVGINAVRSLLPCMEFRLPQCARGVEGLEAYHKKSQTASGLTVDEPVHDWSSHDADGVRVFAEANVAGMIKTGHSINQRLDDESWFGPRKEHESFQAFGVESTMTPLERVLELYKARPDMCFSEDLTFHLRLGVVISRHDLS